MVEQSKKIKPDEVEGKPYIFVSYSRKDEEEVQEILHILRKNHIRFWYDMGLKSGAEWAEELGEKIDKCEQFMVLLSPNSVESKYVKKEIALGTVGFAPPEQFVKDGSKHTTFASDIYALGRTMVCLLCPDKFERNQDAPIRYYRQDVSVELEKIINKMTEKEQEKRYQSAQEVLEDLNNYKQNRNNLILFMESEERRKAYQREDTKRQEARLQKIEDLAKTELLWEENPQGTGEAANPDNPNQVGDSFFDTWIF